VKRPALGRVLIAASLLVSVTGLASAAPPRAELRATSGVLPATVRDTWAMVRIRNVGDAEGRIVSCEVTGPDASRVAVEVDVPGSVACDGGRVLGYAGQADVAISATSDVLGELTASVRVIYDIDIDDGTDDTDTLLIPVSAMILPHAPFVAAADPYDLGVVVAGDGDEFTIWVENRLSNPIGFDRARITDPSSSSDLKVKQDPDGCRHAQVIGPGKGCYVFLEDTSKGSGKAGDTTRTVNLEVFTSSPYDLVTQVRIRYVDRVVPGHQRPEITSVQRPWAASVSVGGSVRVGVHGSAFATDDEAVTAMHLRLLAAGKQVRRVDGVPEDRTGPRYSLGISGYVPVGERIEVEAWAHDEGGRASARKRSKPISFRAIDVTAALARSRSGTWRLTRRVSRAIGRTLLSSAKSPHSRSSLTYRVSGRYVAVVARRPGSSTPGFNGCVRLVVDGVEQEGGCVRATSASRSRIVIATEVSAGTHTVRIRAEGWVLVDGLIVGG
jgi:hypothetical protein